MTCRSYTFFMKEPACVDLTNISFDEFISFLFERETTSGSEKQDPWYWHVETTFDPSIICAYYVRLFQEPEFLSTRFSKAQLEEGFWAIQGPNLNCSAYRIIHETDLPFALRESCIRSMFDLFTRLFSKESLETSVSMWWDSMCYDWHCGNRKRGRGGDDERLQDAFFETLSKLLSSPSESCQGAALHGLGHLHHPETLKLIERYIQERPSLTNEWKAYALSAAKFQVM